MSNAVVDTNRTVVEVPWSMQKLARMITRGFYGIEHLIVMDQLIRNMCMREEELREVTKFDTKMLRSILISLKNDKLIAEKQEVVENPGGRPIRNNYYFIHYLTMINVLKYKIDHIRKKLEAEEMQQVHNALYKCTKCEKTYSDLDVGHLWNGLEMQCSFCNGPVEEDPSALPSQNTRSLMAQFNEQIFPFLQILHEVEDVKLAPFLLNPRPVPLKLDMEQGVSGEQPDGQDGMQLGGRASNKVKAGGGFDMTIGNADISVRIEGHDDMDTPKSAAVKEVPVWLQDPSVSGSVTTPRASETDEANVMGKSPPGPRSHDIMEILTAHEKPAPPLLSPRSDTSGPLLHQDSTVTEESDFEDVAEVHKVTVGGQEYSLAQLAERPDLIAGMTAEEKAEYVAAGQAAYEYLND